MKAVSKWLVPPNVPPHHQWTGEKIQHLARHGDVYLQPTYRLVQRLVMYCCQLGMDECTPCMIVASEVMCTAMVSSEYQHGTVWHGTACIYTDYTMQNHVILPV